jgi:hypothetical protein
MATSCMAGILFPEGQGVLLYSTVSRSALGLAHLPIEWVLEANSPTAKRLGRETGHSPPSSADFTSTPPAHLLGVALN